MTPRAMTPDTGANGPGTGAKATATGAKATATVGRLLIVAASMAGLLLAGIGTVDAATVGVAAMNFRFQPETRSVKVGDIVRWTFNGDPHTVTSGTPGSPDGQFDSGIQDPGSRFQVRFDTAGTYRYFCQIHPEQMTGTIVVTAGPTPRPTASPTPKPTPSPTPKPTPTPTPTPSPTPSPKPTPTPSPRPTPTARTTARPSATATATARATATVPRSAAPPATPAASASPTPTASVSATTTPSPTSTASAGPPSTLPSVGPDAGQSTSDANPLPIVVAAVILGLLLFGGLAYARRPRRGT